MIQDQFESNSEQGKDKNFYLSEEAGLTPLLAMTQSFEDCDWLVVQEGNKSAFKSRVYYCHGAHSREEQGHADEDINSNNSL